MENSKVKYLDFRDSRQVSAVLRGIAKKRLVSPLMLDITIMRALELLLTNISDTDS